MKRKIFLFILVIVPALFYGQANPEILNQFKTRSETYDKSRINYYINSGDLNPDDYEGNYSRGILNFKSGLYEEAIKNFRIFIDESPDIVGAEPEFAKPYYFMAACKLNLREYDSAIYFYTRVLELEPANVEAYNERAVAYVRTGRYSEALSDFESVNFYDKKDYYGLYNIGLTEYLMEDYDQALLTLKKVTRKLPFYEPAYLLVGQIYLDQGSLYNAGRFFSKAIEVSPKSANAYYFSGYTEMLNGLATATLLPFSLAKKDFAEAIYLDEKFIDAYEKAAFVDLIFGEPDKAIYKTYLAKKCEMEIPERRNAASPRDWIAWYLYRNVVEDTCINQGEKKIGHEYLKSLFYESSVEAHGKAALYAILHPQSIFAYQILLYESLRQEQYSEATIFLRRLMAIDTGLVYPRVLQSDLLCQRGRYTAGIRQLKALIEEQPDYLYLQTLLGNKYVEFEKYDSAIAVFNRLLEAAPDNYQIYLQRAEVLYEQGKCRQAFNDLNKYLMYYPKDPYGLLLEGKLYNQFGEADSALAVLEKSLGIIPYFVPAYQEKVNSYMIQDRPNQAVRVYDRMINNGPTAYLGFYHRANLYLDRFENVEWALDDYNKSLTTDPGKTLALEAIGDVYLYHEKDYDTALVIYEKCLEIDEDLNSSLIRMGECYYNLEDYSKATEYFARILESDSLNVRVLNIIGSTYIKLKGYQTALEYFLKASQIEPVSGFALGNLGWCYYLLGDYDKCIEYSQQAIETDSTSYFAMANIALTHLRMGETELASKEYADYIGRAGADEDYDHSEAIADLQGLIDEGVMVTEARNILSKYFGVEE